MGEAHALQVAMVAALREGGTAADVRARVLAQPFGDDVRAWVETWDDRAVRAAVSLMARWGRWDGR